MVAKIGSSLLVEPGGAVRADRLHSVAADVAALREEGTEVVLVSSGAIALGARRLGLASGGRATLPDAQAAAAVGQIALAGLWATALGERALTAAQVLLTLGDLEDRQRYLNARATLGRLLALGAVPVINENDTVATAEIRFGDNDGLAARVAVAVEADRLVLLSDVDGLHEADPARVPDAAPIPLVRAVAEVETLAAPAAAGGLGSGGIASKIAAAQVAGASGVATVVAAGDADQPLRRALANTGSGPGTLFVAEGRTGARKAWLLGRMTVAGTLTVDAGAAAALAGGASLLPAGVTAVAGDFRRGDAVEVRGPDARRIARGLSEYGASEARAIMGLRGEAVAAALGAPPRATLIHRDALVLL